MKIKRILSLVLMSAMLISSIGFTAVASAPTESYEQESYNISSAGGTFSVNLDEIFKPGETYKILFNMKPSAVDTTGGAEILKVSIAEGKTNIEKFIRVYRAGNGNHELCALGAGNFGNIGYITGYPDALAKNGCDVEMIWDTATGTVTTTFNITGTPWTTLPKTFTWDSGILAEGEKYGKLVFTAGTNPVNISGLKIKNINAKEVEPDPTGSYHLDKHKTETGDYLKVDLDRVFQTGLPYKIKFNMKPDDLNGKWCGCVNVFGGDITITNSSGNNYGLFNWYNTGDEAMGLSYWDKIGTVAPYKQVAFKNGVNVEIDWDTALGTANITVDFTEKQYKYEWTPGVIKGKYGNLTIGADSTGVTITNLDISLADGYATKGPEIKKEQIKLVDCDDNEIALDNKVPSDIKEINVEFEADMKLSTLNADNIVLYEKESETAVEYDVKKTVNSYNMSFGNLLKPNCDYVLSFSGDIANATGDKIGTDTEFEFKTGDGVYGFVLDGLKVGVKENPTIQEIAAASKVTAKINVKNTTTESHDCMLVLAYFKGNEMLKAFYDSFTPESTVKNDTVERDITVSSVGDADKVTLLLWDGFGSMITYGDGLTVGGTQSTEPSEKFTDYKNGKIVYSDNVGKANVPVTVQVFKNNKSKTDFAENLTDASANAVYVGQTVTDENGNFTFEFGYKGTADAKDENGIEKLNVCLVYNDTKSEKTVPISYIDGATYQAKVGEINNSADLTAFGDYITKYPFLFGFDSAEADGINKTEAIGKLYNDVKKTPLDIDDSVSIAKRGNNFIFAQKASEGKLTTAMDMIDNLYIPEELANDIKLFVCDSASDKKFVSLLNNMSIDTQKELEDALCEAMILTAVQYPQGFANLKKICEKYSEFIGISGKNYSSTAYKNVAGSTTITSLDELKTALGKPKGGATGGSHTGGGTGGGNVSVSSGNKDENKEEKPSVIKMPFRDLSGFEWAHTAIAALSDKGIVNGKDENNFCPSDYVTREEFAKILVGVAGFDIVAAKGNFTDVDTKAWYGAYVQTAFENDICKGTGDGKFGIGEEITRQDAAVMIYNLLTKKGTELSSEATVKDSADVSDYAAEAVSKLAGGKIINGDENGNFNPSAALTRAEAAQLMYNCMGYCL